MFRVPKEEQDRPARSVWASETEKELQRIREARKELDERDRVTRQRCNHTHEDGSSAIRRTYDDHDDGWYDRCSACGQ